MINYVNLFFFVSCEHICSFIENVLSYKVSERIATFRLLKRERERFDELRFTYFSIVLRFNHHVYNCKTHVFYILREREREEERLTYLLFVD